MPVTFNVRHVEDDTLYLKDELPIEELGLEMADELIHPGENLSYDLQVQKMEKGILVQGSLRIALQCDCARCLKPFPHTLVLDPWACHLALEGEEKVEVVNDCVDLTPHIREDIL